MRRICALVVCLLALSIPTPSEAGGFELRLGGYFPRADTGAENDLFLDLDELFGVRGSDWNAFSGGIEFSAELGSFVEAGVRVDWSQRTQQTSYLEFVDGDGQEIRQTLRLRVVPVGATLRLIPTGPNRIAPYVAVGEISTTTATRSGATSSISSTMSFQSSTIRSSPTARHSAGMWPWGSAFRSPTTSASRRR